MLVAGVLKVHALAEALLFDGVASVTEQAHLRVGVRNVLAKFPALSDGPQEVLDVFHGPLEVLNLQLGVLNRVHELL